MRAYIGWSTAALLAFSLSACGGTASDGARMPASQSVQGGAYLALGDSIPFGDSPLIENQALGGLATSWPKVSDFHGYPTDLAGPASLTVTNAACPGETSGSFLDITARDNGCQAHRKAFATKGEGNGLHVDYSGSQMDFALGFIKDHPETSLITLDLGANDLLLLQSDCGDGSMALGCIAGKLNDVVATAAKNVDTILASLRGAGYKGTIILQNYYQTSYQDVSQNIAIPNINKALAATAAKYNTEVADVESAFQKVAAANNGDTCAAGLIVKLPDGTCNIHPNDSGRALIAQTIAALIK